MDPLCVHTHKSRIPYYYGSPQANTLPVSRLTGYREIHTADSRNIFRNLLRVPRESMPAPKPPRSISRKHELREDKVVTFYARAWRFVDANRKMVYGGAASLVVIAAVIVGYIFYQGQQGSEAEVLLAQVLPLYEQASYQQALDGSLEDLGLLEIADKYGGTPAGNLARFYAADALFNLGEYDRALSYFEDFDKGPDFIGAGAIAGEAAAWEQREEYARAGDLYRRAARHFESELTTPEYLLHAGQLYERAGRYEDALEQYEAVEAEYPESSQASNIRVYIARATAKQSS